jgi:hypothetical protein
LLALGFAALEDFSRTPEMPEIAEVRALLEQLEGGVSEIVAGG